MPAALACLGLGGCMVGPDYHPPALPHGAGVSAAALPAQIGGAPVGNGDRQALKLGADVAGDWWTLFHSPELTALIARALQRNPSLQAAQATLLQARETARAQEGGLFPAISAAFGFTHQRLSSAGFGAFGGSTGTGGSGTGGSGAGGSGTGGSGAGGSGAGGSNFLALATRYDLYNTAINAAYTLDLWGGVRRGIEQAKAQAENQYYALEAAYLTLTANVAAAAVAEASLRAQIDATEQVVAADREGLRIVTAQLAAGAVTRSEVLQQQAELQTTLAQLPPLQSALAQEQNLLASYTGDFPSQFHAASFALETLTLPAELPVSLPSALVQQRPDIQQSAAQLHAATAAVGVATANLLPQITLSGSYGFEALKLGGLFNGGSLAYSLAAQASQTLFQGGTLIHQRRAAIAAMQAAAGQYQATVLNAFANVGDALQALQYDAAALQVALDAANAAKASLDLLQVQFKAGSVNYLSVLVAQRTELNALVTLARARAARYSDTVALFQALGGGWWHRSDVAPRVAACCGLLQ